MQHQLALHFVTIFEVNHALVVADLHGSVLPSGTRFRKDRTVGLHAKAPVKVALAESLPPRTYPAQLAWAHRPG